MLYRLFEPADFAPLYAIEELCFQPPHRFSHAYVSRLTESAQAATWIAEEEGQLAGFAIVEWSPAADTRAAYIQTVEVTPQLRGRGIGSELLRRVEGSASQAGARSVWLHVDAENRSAIGLYESHGYLRMNQEEDYYGPSRPGLVYQKPLVD